MKPCALIVATMDTKARETLFLKECLESQDVDVMILDAGIKGGSPVPVDITRDRVAASAGTSIAEVQGIRGEGVALNTMIRGAVKLAQALIDEGKIEGVIGLGGSMGTTLGTAVMRALPLGFPKVMVTTMASRNTRPFVGTKDILMLHSVCDLAGLNKITRSVLTNGALALAGMVTGKRAKQHLQTPGNIPTVAISTLGTTERCVSLVREELEQEGNEVVTFHTVGSGGQAMDEFIQEQDVKLVLEISLHELADHRFGGDYDAGPNRAMAALEKGVPAILVPGNIDFLVTGPLESAKKRFPGRPFHIHNSAITVVRASAEEMKELARLLADMAKRARGPVAFVIPLGGFSAFDSPNGPLEDKGARHAFSEELKSSLPPHIELMESEYHINDTAFVSQLLGAATKMICESGVTC